MVHDALLDSSLVAISDSVQKNLSWLSIFSEKIDLQRAQILTIISFGHLLDHSKFCFHKYIQILVRNKFSYV